jgi:thioredoxin 1
MSEHVIPVDQTTFQNLVLNSDQQVLVDFSATWCGPCRMIEPLLENIASENSDTLRVVKVDVDTNRQLTHEYQVRSVPTLILFRGGQAIKTHIGPISRDALNQFVS